MKFIDTSADADFVQTSDGCLAINQHRGLPHVRISSQYRYL